MVPNSKQRLLRIAVMLAMLATTLLPAVRAEQNAQPRESAQALQSPPPFQAKEGFNLEDLKQKRSNLEASQDLDESTKQNALKLLDQAIGFRERLNELQRQSEEISQKIKTAPDRIKMIQSELNRPFPPPDSVAAIAAKMDTFQLEQRLQQEQAELATARDHLTTWNNQRDNRESLLKELPENIAKLKTRLKAVEQELQSPPPPDEAAALADARMSLLRAEKAKLNAEVKLYEQRMNANDMLASWLIAESDLANREVAGREALVKAWQDQVQTRRQQAAERAREEAEEAKEKTPEPLSAVKAEYDINIKLIAELEEMTRQEAALLKNLENIQIQLKDLEQEYALAKERVENLTLTEAIGMALRQQRQSLPSIDRYQKSSKERQRKMSEIREAQIRTDRQRRDLANLESKAEKIIVSLGYLPDDRAAALESNVRKLLTDRRDLLEKLQNGYNRYFKDLRNFEFAEQQLVVRAEEFSKFLDTHLLWIRSSPILSVTDLKNCLSALRELVAPGNWQKVRTDVLESFRQSSGLWFLGLLISAVLLGGRRWARRGLSNIALRVDQQQEDRFSLTLRALAVTAYLVAGWPFLMYFLATQLLHLPLPYNFTTVVATGLLGAAGQLATLLFLYQICRRDGLAQIHFLWPEASRRSLRRNLGWVTPIAVSMGFLISAMGPVQEIESGDSLAKLALIIQMTGSSVFLAWMLRFSGGIVSSWTKDNTNGWLARLRYIWWPFAVGMHLFLAALAAVGYFLSALELRNLIRETFWLVVWLIVFNSLALRWLSLARRRFAMREALRKRESAEEATRQQGIEAQRAGTEADDTPIPIEEPVIGITQIDEQTRSLLRTVMLFLVLLGLWAIWEPVFPALGVMEDIQLWSYSSVVDGVPKSIPINLADLMLGVVVAAVTFVASRNLPGLLEITLLNRLPMDSGARYAFTTLCRYAITAIGVILAFNFIGFNWSKLQWLIAALGVGLGFGLQEIVANFICGLIVLFERPFRVGDTVTIGEVTGTVARIRIRAATIIDWDRKELIVPNKEFITGRLINWSLSDPIVRIIIPVGIAYGSDTELAEKLLLKAARGNRLVLSEPEPLAIFKGFGDNSLNFELRVFINGIDNWIPMLHSLNRTIDRQFREAGITISFPQRDVHLDTTGPLEVRVVSDPLDIKSRG
jgi:potassium efflux system protein